MYPENIMTFTDICTKTAMVVDPNQTIQTHGKSMIEDVPDVLRCSDESVSGTFFYLVSVSESEIIYESP